ncbi:MAG: ATP-binding protein, partial [Verrucomicrobiota bacterium]
IYAMDCDWRITYANEKAAGHFQREVSELVGSVLWDEFPDSFHAKNYHNYFRSLTRKKEHSFELQDEVSGCWYEACTYPIGDGLAVFLRDITRRKRTEEQSSKLEKLESLGLLARGFAHDFNNLLTVLRGNLSLAAARGPGDKDYAGELDSARQAAVQAQNLVHQLLTFAKGGAPIKTAINLRQAIDEIFEGHQQNLHTAYHLNQATVELVIQADKSQVRRLIENLIRNAEEAMPRGGELTLATSMFKVDQHLFPHLDPENEYVKIEITDNGEGIPRVNLDKVFEPYYSTRTDANATGLGLTVCDSIVRAHEGAILIESNIGVSTTVSVVLPLAGIGQEVETPGSINGRQASAEGQAGQVSPPRPAGRAPEEKPSEAGRILVLEDDALVRQLVVATLRKEGYRIDETEEGSATVERYKEACEKGEVYDLVIMDLCIPNGMGGADAMEQILLFDPNVTAIVSSGYSDDPVMANHKQYGFTAVLPKPYEPRELAAMAREVIEGRRHQTVS